MEDQGVPTEGEIDLLPRWTKVAFAVRCAVRVNPFVEGWGEATENDKRLIWLAINASEKCSEGGRFHGGAGAAKLAQRVVDKARENSATGAEHAASAAIDADQASVAAGMEERFDSVVPDNVDASNTASVFRPEAKAYTNSFVMTTAESARRSGHAIGIDISSNIRKDFKTAKEASRTEQWTDQSAVPSKVFGPMWPEGEPSGWPESE